MKELTVTIDHLPESILMPNKARRLHWSVRAKISAIAREEAKYESLSMGQWATPPKANIFYRFTVRDKRKRDLDNLISACKPFLDGLIDAGVLKSDDGWYLSISGAEIVKGDKSKTELIIREEEK